MRRLHLPFDLAAPYVRIYIQLSLCLSKMDSILSSLHTAKQRGSRPLYSAPITGFRRPTRGAYNSTVSQVRRDRARSNWELQMDQACASPGFPGESPHSTEGARIWRSPHAYNTHYSLQHADAAHAYNTHNSKQHANAGMGGTKLHAHTQQLAKQKNCTQHMQRNT